MIYTPKYFNEFSCRASSCPDSCCRAGWEIPIDAETYDFYKSAGIDVDKNSYTAPDGDRVFALREDKSCAFFRPDGLCDIYIKTGGRLCEICGKYPRFFEEYDGFTEAGLSVSCPTAAEMILTRKDDPYKKHIKETDEELFAIDEMLEFLVRARERAMEMIYSEKDPDDAAKKLYEYGFRLQRLLDWELPAMPGEAEFVPEDVLDEDALKSVKRFLLTQTEILTPRWRELLQTPFNARAGTVSERRNYLAYLTFRYFLKAINTGNIAAYCKFILLMYRLSQCICPDYAEAVRLISKELEHNADNIREMNIRFLMV